MREPLSYAIAHKAAEAALDAARAEGARICVAVVNRSGITKVLLSDDGVGPIGIETARRKAYTAAVTGVPTSKFAAFAASPAMAVAPVHHVDAGLLAVPGGVPITVDDGEVIGAVGGGGRPPPRHRPTTRLPRPGKPEGPDRVSASAARDTKGERP